MALDKVLSVFGLAVAALAFSAGTAKADTTYTYTGNPYIFCEGTYTCTGTTPAIRVMIDIATGTVLTNLPLTDISADIVSFSITDGENAPVKVLLAGSADGIQIGTDANGNVTTWNISGGFPFSTPPATFTNLSFATLNYPGSEGDFSSTTVIQGQNFLEGDGFAFVPGTWTVSGLPEPSSLALLGVGILGLMGLSLKMGR